MTAEQIAALLQATADLVGVLVWPVIVLFMLIQFGPGLQEFFENLSELTFKAAGVEATAKRRAEVAAALGAAVAKSAVSGTADVARATEQAREVAEVVAKRVNTRSVREAQGTRVLWVDDRPDNNVFERRSLEALGIRFDLSTSTEDALTRLAAASYDAVISDMGRSPDPQAGYTLLEAMRKSGDQTPFVIYAGSNATEHKKEARRRGAIGSTNSAAELFELVLSALGVHGERHRRGV